MSNEISQWKFFSKLTENQKLTKFIRSENIPIDQVKRYNYNMMKTVLVGGPINSVKNLYYKMSSQASPSKYLVECGRRSIFDDRRYSTRYLATGQILFDCHAAHTRRGAITIFKGGGYKNYISIIIVIKKKYYRYIIACNHQLQLAISV